MTIYIRNSINQTMYDLEVYPNKEGFKHYEISAAVPIRTYSELLLSRPDDQEYIIESFETLDDIRRWYWEQFVEINEDHTQKQLTDAIIGIIKPICEKLGLYIVID